MASAVRAGDVYIIQIPGDNGETKPRRCIILDGVPNPYDPTVVLLIFGCSETKRNAKAGRFNRVETSDKDFGKIGLANATTFHIEDIRFYDANSPVFSRPPPGKCGKERMLALRALLDQRLDEDEPIPLLPRQASEKARAAARAYFGSDEESSGPPLETRPSDGSSIEPQPVDGPSIEARALDKEPKKT